MSDILQLIFNVGEVTCPQCNPVAEMSDILQPTLSVGEATCPQYNPVAVLQHNIISRGRRGFIACPQNPVAELLKTAMHIHDRSCSVLIFRRRVRRHKQALLV